MTRRVGRVDASRLSLPYLTPTTPDVQRGDPIFVFGYPGIGEGYLAFTEGTVTTIRNGSLGDDRFPVWYQTDATIAPGNSGGLAVNAQGEMIGIPTAVRTEDFTGGRLGGILSSRAVTAALAGGLVADTRSIAQGTTSPVIEGGRLDYAQEPHFGETGLAAGFTPDPHTIEMVSGGEVAVSYLGGGCTGYAAIAPDYRLYWNGRSSDLRIFFIADDGGDTTLLVNRPDGSWVCNDDAEGGTFDPMIVLENAPSGQYDIWVGSYSAGDFIDGTLYITELTLGPTSARSDELDPSREAYFGSRSLRAGFTPDPFTAEILAGGSIDVSYLGGSCVGYAARTPDLHLEWSGRSDELRIFFEADDDMDDPTLIVRAPNGSYYCNDDDPDTIFFNPMVRLSNPPAGRYTIWVGTYERGEFIDGVLSITELDLGPW